MEYKVAEGFSAGKLTNAVNELLVEGWEPIGGVAVESNGVGMKCYQAMIRKTVPANKTPAPKKAAESGTTKTQSGTTRRIPITTTGNLIPIGPSDARPRSLI